MEIPTLDTTVLRSKWNIPNAWHMEIAQSISVPFPSHGGQFYVMDIKLGSGIRKTADSCVNLGKDKTLSLFTLL